VRIITKILLAWRVWRFLRSYLKVDAASDKTDQTSQE